MNLHSIVHRIRRALPVALALAAVSLLTGAGSASERDSELSRLNSLRIAYVYNFTRFISWEGYTGKTFTLCLVSDNPELVSEFNLLEHKSDPQQPISTRILDRGDDPDDCQLLYLQQRSSLSPEQLAHQNNLLIVSDQPLSYAHIQFEIVENSLRFSINSSLAISHGLKVSSKLLRLAREVR